MILGHAEVLARYEALLPVGQSGAAVEWLSRLPPYLARCLILGRGLKTATASFDAALSGSESARHLVVGQLHMCVGGFSSRLFNSLPLKGHEPLLAPGLGDWLAQALEMLEAASSAALGTLYDWCSTVLWVAPSEDAPPQTVLTSVALPLLPHCIVLSVKGLRHIPPKHVYEGASIYALAENLYHEALHHQLTCSLLFGPPLLDGSKTPADLRVVVPWRGAEWEIDRVLHAAWIYLNIQRLRETTLARKLLCGAERAFVMRAHSESSYQVKYLCNALSKSADRLAPAGQALARHLLSRITDESLA